MRSALGDDGLEAAAESSSRRGAINGMVERVSQPTQRKIDCIAVERAARGLLEALGADLDSEQLRETPRRMAEAYRELLTSEPFSLTSFPNDEGYDELVVVRDIPFQSLCIHHVLPFHGVAHVAYLPGGANPRALEARRGGRAVLPRSPTPRATDVSDCAVAAGRAQAEGGRRCA